jgi:hypothetical protein
MTEAALLSLLLRHPHPAAIARRVNATTLHEGISRLERAGLLTRGRAAYRVTARGRSALELHQALEMSVRRGLGAAERHDRPASAHRS